MRKTRWIDFLGGQNTIYTLVLLILIGLTILLYHHMDFIFEPIITVIAGILVPIVISFLIYYALVPIVDFLEDKGMKRIWAVAIVYVVLTILTIWGLSWAIPTLVEQLESLALAFPDYVEKIAGYFLEVFDDILDVPELAHIFDSVEDWFANLPTMAVDFITGSLQGLTQIVSSVTSLVVSVFFIPVVLFFLLKDSKLFYETFMKLIPPARRKGFMRITSLINHQVGSYVKGQFFVCTILGILTWLSFKVIGLSYAGLLGVLTALTSVIPYVGFMIALATALIIAAFDSWAMVVKVFIVWMIIQFLEGNIISPNIMGKQLDIHPLTIMILVFVAGDLMGLFGMIFAVPMFAILKVLLNYAFEKYKGRYNEYFADQKEKYPLQDIKNVKTNEEDIAQNYPEFDDDREVFNDIK